MSKSNETVETDRDAPNHELPTNNGSEESVEQPEVTEHVERTDVGASIEVTMTRGTATRDQEKVKAKTKAATVEEARGDMDDLKPWLKEFVGEVRSWQPEEDED